MKNILKRRFKSLNDYLSEYISDRELLIFMILIMLLGVAIGWVFYRHIIGSIIISIFMLAFIPEYISHKKKQIKLRLMEEFVIINNILLGEISASASIENTYVKLGEQARNREILGINLLNDELIKWSKAIDLGQRPENVLISFAHKLDDMTILQHAYVFKLARKQGADLKKVILTTNRVLREKTRIAQDISVLVSEKKLEQKIMSLMPVVMVVLLGNGSGSFIGPLYDTVLGRILMTVLLILFSICYVWSNRITDIV